MYENRCDILTEKPRSLCKNETEEYKSCIHGFGVIHCNYSIGKYCTSSSAIWCAVCNEQDSLDKKAKAKWTKK